MPPDCHGNGSLRILLMVGVAVKLIRGRPTGEVAISSGVRGPVLYPSCQQ